MPFAVLLGRSCTIASQQDALRDADNMTNLRVDERYDTTLRDDDVAEELVQPSTGVNNLTNG